MRLTKEDKRRIESDVQKVEFRIEAKISEYERLYERTYLEALREKIDIKLKVLDDYPEMLMDASNKDVL